MVNVSGAFTEKISQLTTYSVVYGTLTVGTDVISIETNDLVGGSVSIVSKAISGNYFSIGEVYIDSLSFSVGISDTKTWENIAGGIVELFYKLDLGDGFFEEVALGKFTIPISGVKYFRKTVSIKADSNMFKFDKDLGGVTTSGTPYQILYWICNACNVTLGMSEEEVEALPNGLIAFGMPADNNGCETYRDVLMYIAQLTCCFATINRAGMLVLKSYIGTSVYTINTDTLASSSFWGSNLDIDNVSMTIGGTYYTVESGVSSDKTLQLDENPLFRNNQIDEDRMEYLTSIKNQLQQVDFLPFEVTFNGNPALEVGDYITVKNKVCMITSITWAKGKSTLKGVGLSTGNTKTQGSTTKGTISGSTGGTDNVKISRYENAAQIVIGNTSKILFDFVFELNAKISPRVSFSAVLNVQTAGTFEITLIYDSVTLFFKPKATYSVGYHTFSLYLPLQARDVSMTHVLQAYITSADGSATIDMYQLLASVEAYGLADGTAEFYGRLSLQQSIAPIPLTWGVPLSLTNITESVENVLT